MTFEVDIEYTGRGESVSTHWTLVWSFTSVKKHVRGKVIGLNETLSTHGTRIWPNSIVNSLVYYQMTLCPEPFVTHCTLVRLGTSVQTDVIVQNSLLSKSLSASHAAITLITAIIVYHFVLLKFVAGKSLHSVLPC